MQAFELTILNWIQAHLRCGVLDAVMVPVSRICDHGEVWILLAAILLAIPKTRPVWPAGWFWIFCSATLLSSRSSDGCGPSPSAPAFPC